MFYMEKSLVPPFRTLPLLAIWSARAVVANAGENRRNLFWIPGRYLRPLRLSVYAMVALFSLVKHWGRAEVWQDGEAVLIFSTCGKAPFGERPRWRRALLMLTLSALAVIAFVLPLFVFGVGTLLLSPPRWARRTIGIPFGLVYLAIAYVYLVVLIRTERRQFRFNTIRVEATLRRWQLVSLITRPMQGPVRTEADRFNSSAIVSGKQLLASLIQTARNSDRKGVFAFDVLVSDPTSLDGLLEPTSDPAFASWMPALYLSPLPATPEPSDPPIAGPARWSLVLLGFTMMVVFLTIAAGIFGLLTLLYEHGYCVSNPSERTCIRTPVDAIYWALTTMTTTGYGDLAPHSFMGRLMAVILMGTGVVAFGIVVSFAATAMVTAIEKDERWLNRFLNTPHGIEAETDLRAMREMLKQLLRDREAPAAHGGPEVGIPNYAEGTCEGEHP
jgi:hypothetical protein